MSAQDRNADLKKNNFCTMSSVVYNDVTEVYPTPLKHNGSMEREFPSPERVKISGKEIVTTKSHYSAKKELERMAKKRQASKEKKSTKSPNVTKNSATAAYPLRPQAAPVSKLEPRMKIQEVPYQ
jgi:hypothetical protein